MGLRAPGAEEPVGPMTTRFDWTVWEIPGRRTPGCLPPVPGRETSWPSPDPERAQTEGPELPGLPLAPGPECPPSTLPAPWAARRPPARPWPSDGPASCSRSVASLRDKDGHCLFCSGTRTGEFCSKPMTGLVQQERRSTPRAPNVSVLRPVHAWAVPWPGLGVDGSARCWPGLGAW